jgi:hypothetical protein
MLIAVDRARRRCSNRRQMQAYLKMVLAIATNTHGFCTSTREIIRGNNHIRVSDRLEPISLPRLSYAHMLLLTSQ